MMQRLFWSHTARRSYTLSSESILRSRDNAARKTKVVCTLGPACWSIEGLTSLIDAGMNVARFNFSHGDHSTHAACLARLREADTKGPEIRSGVLDDSLGGKLILKKGSKIEVGSDFRPCTPQYLSCSYNALAATVRKGGKILIADGSVTLTVLEVKENSVIAEVMNDAIIGSRKNMNLPGAEVDLPTVTEKDIDDLVNFGLVYGIDAVAASFVRKGADIDLIRSTLGKQGSHIKIIAKIENQEGLDNYDEILEKTDGIMVARGDLGMEIPLEKVFLAQKMMIAKANVLGRPVVTATQMLESMITNPRPTRAECADVANAVLDGTDCVMLSGETANGGFPADAVRMMSATCVEAEAMQDYDSSYRSMRQQVLASKSGRGTHMSTAESIASSAVKTAWDLKAGIIVVVTRTGNTARLVAKYRPSVPIIVLTPSEAVARQCQGYLKNCYSRVTPLSAGLDNVVASAVTASALRGWCKPGGAVVCVHGELEGSEAPGSTNSIRIITA